MKIELSKRMSGKTTRLVAWVRENNTHVLVTFSEEEKARLQRVYPDIAGRVKTLTDFKNGSSQGGHSVVGIDNADMILQKMIERPIEYININYKEEDTVTKYGVIPKAIYKQEIITEDCPTCHSELSPNHSLRK